MASVPSKKKRKDEVIPQDSDEDSSSEVESESSESDIDPDLALPDRFSYQFHNGVKPSGKTVPNVSGCFRAVLTQDLTDMKSNPKIQVEFQARTPEASDFDGIKRLLKQLLLKSNINLSEVTDLILNQSKVGSVVKCFAEEDDDDDMNEETYGITTVLHLNRHKEVESIKDFLKLVTTRCPSEKFLKFLRDSQHSIGWLISERFINIPADIAPPLYASLRSEIIEANKKGKAFDFDYLLYMCKSCKMDISSKKSKKKQGEETEDILFINAEDELLYQKATATFDYDVTEECDTLVMGKWRKDDAQMRSYRTVMLIPWKDMEKIVTEMEQYGV